jgi:uncharacterized protein (TIGR02147 family)
MPNIFEYTDYRKFLQDYYDEVRKTNPRFSHRYFAMKAGFTSTGLFANILKGRRNLTGPLILKFSKALKLKKKEEEYFESLVFFNQAKSFEEKNKFYERMLALSPLRIQVVNRDKFEFYSQWWYSAIRELLYFFPFKDDYQALAKKLNPPVRPDQAKKAVKALEKLGLIKKNKKGYYEQTASLITTEKDHEKSMHVANFQRATMQLAMDSLDRHTRDVRDISTLTLTLSRESYQKAKMEIDALQTRLLKMAEQEKKVDRVYQINFQVFPLSGF